MIKWKNGKLVIFRNELRYLVKLINYGLYY